MSAIGMQFGLQRFEQIILNETVDYSGIISSLNLLTNSSDTVYDGTNPSLSNMETQLDLINREIIIP
jgi:hypothetical protein